MPWKEVTAMEQKKKFIEAYRQKNTPFTNLCLEFGITPKTGYKYVKRFQELGILGLNEVSRRPKTSPLKTPERIEQIIVDVRRLHPSWSGEKIARYLKNKGYEKLPTEKTMNRIIKRHGFISIEESEKHTPWHRFEHENPNDLWQMDFKGHFEIQHGRCHPLTVLDDHSRYSLLIKACENEREHTVKQALITTFLEYGLPLRMTMDNGAPWGSSQTFRYTTLSVWLIHLGIRVSYSRPRHPQTQGKLERFHRTLKTELLNRFSFSELKDAQDGFNWWRKIYNEERPHGALGLDVPANRYKHSSNPYPEKLPTIEYENGMIVRRVQKYGVIGYRGNKYKIGYAFRGYPVGLKETLDDGVYDVFLHKQKVGSIDLRYPC